MRVTNKEIAHLLRSVAAVYVLEEKNRFRIIAYDNAADTVEYLNREVQDIWENGQLLKISGIGSTIASHIDEYFRKGNDSYLVKTINRYPASIYLLMKVPGIGPKKAYKLVRTLHLKDEKTVVADLKKAAQDGRVAEIEGFGEKSALEIENSLNLYTKSQSGEVRMPLPYADRLAQDVKKHLLKNKSIIRIDTLGSLRRQVATIGDVDLAVVIHKGHEKEIIEHFLTFPGRVKTIVSGPKKATMTLANGADVDLRVSDEESYGAMLQYNTGSKSHNIRLREYALRKGFSLSEYGITEVKSQKVKVKGTVQNSKVHLFRNEESFYKFLGMQAPPPELREGTNEIDLAIKGKMPHLVEFGDLKGDFHIHSDYDLKPSHDLGRSNPDDLIKKAKELKYEYIALSDHNPSVGNHTAGQITAIMKRRYEALTKYKKKFPIIISCEVDILPKGQLALPQASLEYVDMVIVSIHSSFKQSRKDITARILKALSYPKVRIFGHPTARLLGRRPEIDADWPAIFTICKNRNITIEINSWPERLDLPDVLVREAKDLGVKFVIDTDAHAVEQMENMKYGVSVARRGWLSKNDIINTKSFEEVKKWIEK